MYGVCAEDRVCVCVCVCVVSDSVNMSYPLHRAGLDPQNGLTHGVGCRLNEECA